jgi:nucleotide-binding universal stress UspA family protein
MNTVADPRPGTTGDIGPDEIAAAIGRELRGQGASPAAGSGQRGPGVPVVCVDPAGAVSRSPCAVLVGRDAPRTGRTVVAAAVDDDGNPGPVVRFAAAQARRLGIPLRVVHVWTGADRTAPYQRVSCHDDIVDADRLLSVVLYDNLPAQEADAAEREIRHDRDPVRALIDLSADASMVVLAARSSPGDSEDPLGDTCRALVGRTSCPLAVLPPDEEEGW